MNSEKEKIIFRMNKIFKTFTPEQKKYYEQHQQNTYFIKTHFGRIDYILDKIKNTKDTKIQDMHKLEIKFIKLLIIQESSR